MIGRTLSYKIILKGLVKLYGCRKTLWILSWGILINVSQRTNIIVISYFDRCLLYTVSILKTKFGFNEEEECPRILRFYNLDDCGGYINFSDELRTANIYNYSNTKNCVHFGLLNF